MQNVHLISTKQLGGIKSSVSRCKNSTNSQAVCAGAPFCWKV